jgi:hypothetical protein
MRRLELELSLHPDDARRLPALPELAMPAADRTARSRPTPVRLVWHDTPDGSLAASGVSLTERRLGRETSWRVERMRPLDPPAGGAVWAPGTPAPLVAEAAEAAGLSGGAVKLPAPLLPLAGLEGRQRTIPAHDGVVATLLQGELRTLTAARPVCRMTLAGARSSVAPMALALADKVRLAVPPATLAAEAYAAAGHPALAPRRQGAPALPPGLSVDDAFAALIAHLLDVILHQAGRAAAGEAPEPVHQMRVAVRRLRSACSLFKRAATCPQLDEA